MKRTIIPTAATLTALWLLMPCQPSDGATQGIPDLTQGGELTRINKRWAGPLGIHCGAWRPAREQKFEDVRQLLVLEVDKGSPADGVLEVDDVILGADGTGAAKVPMFEGSELWPMVPIANAITEAEARNPALLKLLVWRKGVTKTVTVKLESLGRYSDTAPYDCHKSQAILRKGIEALYEENKFDEAGLGILCLLAANDPTNPDNDKYQARAREWVYKLDVGGNPWYSGPKLMALSEYYMQTKDEGIFPKLVAQAEYHAQGVSWFGTAGHRWADMREDGSGNGRISGYGPITASGVLGYLGLSLAREAGVKSPIVEKSHEAQRIFFGHYAFKSGMGYGEHPYGIGGGTDDYNAKQANSGLAVGMDEGREETAKYFTRVAALSSMNVRQYAHGGSFFGQVFHPLGANQGGEKAAHMLFEEIRWHLDLKRRWDHTRIYDASGNRYDGFHWGGTALIFYAAPLKQIYLTGRGQKDSLKFTDAEFKELQEIKNFDATQATTSELLATLSRYHGMLRETAASELANRVKSKPDSSGSSALIDQLLTMAADESNNTFGRTGACCTLMLIKDKSQEPVTSMKNAEIAKTMAGLLKDPEAYIRFAGVRVLQKLDAGSVRPHGNEILDAIIATGRPTFPLDEEDPLQWAHGEMGVLLNDAFGNNLDGLDHTRLIPALRSLLQTPNGGARGAVTKLLAKLSKEQTLAVADLLVDNIRTLPPGNAMGGPGATVNSQAALANFLFEETLPLSAEHGVQAAIKNGIPQKFGKSALQIEAAAQFMQALGDQILIEAVDAKAVADGIAKDDGPEELLKLKRIDGIKAGKENLKLPEAQTELTVDATNFAVTDESGTTYKWRKLCGAGKVSFTPNGSAHSKTTTVTFTDKKPGRYRFEVTMSDTLGLNTLRETVAVTLYDSSGKLPSNRPPQAKSQSLDAAPGQPVPVTLSGADPDGDDLGFMVTQPPMHGRLTDAEGRPLSELAAIDGPVIYTALYGYNGKDQFTFMTIDGQGETAAGSVELNVSDKDVGVAVYENFDYPEGVLHGREGGGSFGFTGPWQGSKGADSPYRVLRSSVNYPNASGASLSLPTLPSGGGRVSGQRHISYRRALDPKVLADHKLLENGGELWFSVFIDHPELMFELKGPDVGLGFRAVKQKQELHATLNGATAGTNRNPFTRSANLRFPDTHANMIVGRCVWGKTDEDPDRLTIHRVYDAPGFGPMLLEKPACILEEVIAQQTLDSVFLNIDSGASLDEIRIGPTLNSVMTGTKPLQ